MRALQAVTAALGAAESTDEVARVILDEGSAHPAVDGAALYRVAPGGDGLALLGAVGFDLGAAASWARAGHDTLVRAALGAPEGVWARDGRDADGETIPASRAAWVALPCAVTGDLVRRVLGVLLLRLDGHDDDPELDGYLLALAQQCGNALERARLLEAERAAARRARLLHEVTSALGTAVGADDVAREIGGRVTQRVGARDGALYVVDAERTTLERVGSPVSRGALAAVPGALRRDEEHEVAEVVRTGRSRFVEADTESHAMLPLWAGAPGRRAPAGVLLLAFDAGRRFGTDERALLESIAAQCAQALERARLYDAERDARAEAERARHEAERASRTKSDFLAMMSHELRTPLNVIGGFTQLLADGVGGPLPDKARDYVARIAKSEAQLLAVIDEVLGFARLEEGRVAFRAEAVEVARLLAEVEPRVAPQVAARALRLERPPVPAGIRAKVDREKAAQILIALVANAVKFTPPGGTIALSASADEESVRLAVTDTGIGIAADDLDQIFEPFVQTQSTLTRDVGGVGLGLSISRDLARGMGGDLLVESTPGEGSTFVLRLPRA